VFCTELRPKLSVFCRKLIDGCAVLGGLRKLFQIDFGVQAEQRLLSFVF
jgi:hypothetical protein